MTFVDGSRVGHFFGEIGNGCLTQVVGGFSHQGMDEICSTKGAGDEGVDIPTVGSSDLDVASDVREDIVIAQRDEGKLAEVGVGGKVFPGQLEKAATSTDRVCKADPRSLKASY